MQTDNSELTQLHDEDQADRSAVPGDAIDGPAVEARDRARRERVGEILAAGGATTAADHYHAAMVYQHGDSLDDIQRAHELALEAVRLDPGHAAARFLAAASEDRRLLYENRPQRWGTQYTLVDCVWVLWPVDPATTDAQRAEWNVRPLADAQALAARLNARE